MSAATEYAPAVCIPAAARPLDGAPQRSAPGLAPRIASVTTLHAPRDAAVAAPLRLTHRGVAVVAVLVAALAGALFWLAARSAPAGAGVRGGAAPTSVAVQPGDTLWSIATRVAPQRDPRAEVDALVRANHLSTVDLVPGQTLRVP